MDELPNEPIQQFSVGLCLVVDDQKQKHHLIGSLLNVLKKLMIYRGKSLLELWDTAFLPDWQPPLIFVQFISNFLYMCSNSVDSAHVFSK